jgi:hypothetical protein
MSRLGLADRDSSTLIYTTDSVEDMVAFMSTIVTEDGTDALDGLSLSVQRAASNRFHSFADAAMIEALNAYENPTPSTPPRVHRLA